MLPVSVALLAGLAGVGAAARTSLPMASLAASSPSPSGTGVVPRGVTLSQIDGGPHYYAHIAASSAWMDRRIMIGGWLEQPITATEVGYDVAMGNNIY